MGIAEPRPSTPALTDAFAFLRDATVSSYREQLVEYAFVSELLQDGWLRRGQPIDVLRSDVDAAGYDLVLECQGIVRHVQLKSTVAEGKAARQNVHRRLAACASGCVVWVVLEPVAPARVQLRYRVFGSAPGLPLENLDKYRIARSTRGDATGHKPERPAIRAVPKSRFVAIADTAALSNWLFGEPRAALARD